jgi:hypothetical protein
MLWGATGAAAAGLSRAEPLARTLASLLLERFAHPQSGLPRHTLGRWRGHVVSFGSLVYFLRALGEYGRLVGDAQALDLVRRGVARALEVQGPQGEWPWMLDLRSGLPLDFYPVFTVHQDSMAMLFLHPALDEGVPGVREAVEASVAWNFGHNQLGVPLVVREPFHVHRSIERTDRLPRARRYARTLACSRAGRPATLERNERLRVNDECRSYHLGWVLYVWAGRTDEPACS